MLNGIRARKIFIEEGIQDGLIITSKKKKLFHYEGRSFNGGFFSLADPKKVGLIINLALKHDLLFYAQYFLRLVIYEEELYGASRIKYWEPGFKREGRIMMVDFLSENKINFNIPLRRS